MIMTDEFKPIIRDPHKSANMLEQPVAPVPVPQPPSDPIEQVLSPREVSEGLAKADPLTRHPRVSSIMLSVVFGLLLLAVAVAVAVGVRLEFGHFFGREPGVTLLALLLLALGTLMDMAPLILTPILLPVVTSFGVDPVHFGMIMLVNLGIGLITPPVGAVLFVGAAIGKVTIENTVKALLPFYAALFMVLMAVTYIPAISLWLPSVVLPWCVCMMWPQPVRVWPSGRR